MLRRRHGQEPPSVRPFDVDGVRTVAIGTVLWTIAFVVLALFREDLDEEGMGWWLWTCLAGVGLGLLGLEYTRKRRDAIARARLEEEANGPDDLDALPGSDDVEFAGRPDDVVSAEAEDLRPEPGPPAAEPEPQRAEAEPHVAEVEPLSAEPELLAAEVEPYPAEAEPASVAEELAETGLLEVEPAPAPPSSRRERRAARAIDQSAADLDEPLLPEATGELGPVRNRPTGGHRARSGATLDEDEINEGGVAYRGRRARRP